MITKLTLVTVLVRDQDEALRWFTEIAGLRKLQDGPYGNGSRWLVVAPEGQSDFGIVLQKPEPARMDQIGKGTTWVFRADNLDETWETLSARGVRFLSPPAKMPWGRQAIFEDLYGNRYALMGQ